MSKLWQLHTSCKTPSQEIKIPNKNVIKVDYDSQIKAFLLIFCLPSCKMHNTTTLGNQSAGLVLQHCVCLALHGVAACMKGGVDQFQQQTAWCHFWCDFAGLLHSRATTQRGSAIFAQDCFFLFQSATDGALNKRLSQSVHSTPIHPHGSLLNWALVCLQRTLYYISCEHSADCYLAFWAVFRPGKTLFQRHVL